MNLVLFVVFVALFVALTPSVLLRLPSHGSKIMVAVTHGVIFALVWTIIYKPVMSMTRGLGLNFMEGLETNHSSTTATAPVATATAPATKQEKK